MGRGEYFLHIVPGTFRHALFAERKLGKTLDRCERSAHIMAHVGQKSFFLLSGFDGSAQGFGHFLDLFLVPDPLCRINESQYQSADIFISPFP